MPKLGDAKLKVKEDCEHIIQSYSNDTWKKYTGGYTTGRADGFLNSLTNEELSQGLAYVDDRINSIIKAKKKVKETITDEYELKEKLNAYNTVLKERQLWHNLYATKQLERRVVKRINQLREEYFNDKYMSFTCGLDCDDEDLLAIYSLPEQTLIAARTYFTTQYAKLDKLTEKDMVSGVMTDKKTPIFGDEAIKRINLLLEKLEESYGDIMYNYRAWGSIFKSATAELHRVKPDGKTPRTGSKYGNLDYNLSSGCINGTRLG